MRPSGFHQPQGIALAADANVVAVAKRVTSAETLGDTDDLFLEPARRRLYVSGGEGSIDGLTRDLHLRHYAPGPTEQLRWPHRGIRVHLTAETQPSPTRHGKKTRPPNDPFRVYEAPQQREHDGGVYVDDVEGLRSIRL